MTTKSRIEYHLSFVLGGLCILFIEVKIVIGTAAERRNVIAQVIAESDGQHISTSPLYCKS